MPKDTIYLYVDGFDLEESEEELLAAFSKLAEEWNHPSLMLINDRTAPNPGLSGDLPKWSLGFNIAANALTAHDINSLLRFAKDLATRTGHDFVFGLADRQKQVSEDICFLDAEAGDAEQLMMLTAITKH